jgi:hypothetical protein
MAKLYTPEIEALVLAERKATIDAIGRIPYGEITSTCYQWCMSKGTPKPLQKFIDDRKAAELADKIARDMIWTSLGDATAHTFPAGKYYIGDPCYVLDDEIYDAIVIGSGEGFFTNGTHTIGFFGTAYGDGCYRGTNGKTYGVDAGIIGIVPAELMKGGSDGEGTLTFENEFKFGCTSDATFYVKDEINPRNSFQIPTKDCDEDEEDSE